jgi:SAM-dependent methyltransferase
MEAGIYKKLYERKDYRVYSPGERLVPEFLKVAKPYPNEKLIDFGCGTGRAAKKLSKHLNVTAVDFADNAIETDVEFKVHDLREPFVLEKPYDYGYCCDVMEHIATEDVPKVLANILSAARKVFFQISTVPDHFGQEVGETLHLTVKPMSWWLQQIEQLGAEVKWARHGHGAILLYVSAFANWQHVTVVGELTVSDEEQLSNIRANVAQRYREVEYCEGQDTEVMLLAGGPSLAKFEDDIRYQRSNGMPIVTTNGAYNWCLERGITPSAQVILDSREFNKRFVEPVVPNCRYLLGSTCHPSVLASVPREQLWMWHSPVAKDAIDAEYGNHTWFPIHGGSTVMLRAMVLLQLLGFRKFHVYGFDSCLSDGAHHAYAQPENDQERITEILVGGRSFTCHYWMVVQARDYIEMVKRMLQDCEMAVYGDGLIAHILKTGARLEGD